MSDGDALDGFGGLNPIFADGFKDGDTNVWSSSPWTGLAPVSIEAWSHLNRLQISATLLPDPSVDP